MRGRKWGLVYHFSKFVWDTPNFLIKNDQNDKEAEKNGFYKFVYVFA